MSNEFNFGDLPTSLPIDFLGGQDGSTPRIKVSEHINFDVPSDSSTLVFMRDVAKTLVQQPDYGGMSGHGIADHGPHGLHDQVDIKIGDSVFDFRVIR